jgi:hypothetical protein
MITGGTAETSDGHVCSVPKLTLVSRVQALLHQGRLRILRPLAEADALVRELSDFRVQYTAAGNIGFVARSGRHDDLVLALAIALWRAEGGGMAGHGIFEYYRQEATGQATSMFVGVDLGQSHDPTAICVLRKVESPAPQDLGEPLSPRIYEPGSAEERRTAAPVPPSAQWRQKFDAALVRETPSHPDVPGRDFEPARREYAKGSLEWAAQQRDKEQR